MSSDVVWLHCPTEQLMSSGCHFATLSRRETNVLGTNVLGCHLNTLSRRATNVLQKTNRSCVAGVRTHYPEGFFTHKQKVSNSASHTQCIQFPPVNVMSSRHALSWRIFTGTAFSNSDNQCNECAKYPKIFTDKPFLNLANQRNDCTHYSKGYLQTHNVFKFGQSVS